MKILLKKTLVAAVAAAAMTVGMVDTASAGAKAFAHLQISDFRIFKSDGVNNFDQYDASDFDVLRINNNASTFADTTLHGTQSNTILDDAAGANPLAVPPKDNLSCVGVGCPGEDVYIQQAPPAPGDSFARGDSQLLGALITGLDGVPFSPSSVTADSLSEGQTNITDKGEGNSSVGTITDISFSTNADSFVGFSFIADGLLEALLHQDEVATFASMNFSITVTDITDGVSIPVFNFAPLAINTSVGQLIEGQSSYATGPLGVSGTTGLLLADNEYRLTIDHRTRATFDAVKDVPEPATLALFGLGLLGVGAARMSRKTKS